MNVRHVTTPGQGAHHVFVFFSLAILQQPKNGLPVRIQLRSD
jgi:hypothetical protein